MTGRQTEWGVSMDQRVTEVEEIYENDIWSSTTGDYMPPSVASAAISTTGVSVECSLDLSAITGSYYIGLALKNTNAIAMKQLYLED